MISKITYARLYNLGNYENERLEVEVTVTEDSAAGTIVAWAEAVGAVEQQHARLETERQEAEQRRRAEYQAEQERQRAEREAERERRRQSTYPPAGDPPF